MLLHGAAAMTTPERAATAEHKLLRAAEHEAPDPTELSLREAFALLRHRLRPPFSLQTPSPSDYHHLVLALAYGVLTQPPRAARTHLVHLHAVVSDGYDLFTRTLLRLSLDSYPGLLPPARSQLLWVTSELIAAAAIGVDRLVVSLLRWVTVGDFSPHNLWLAGELLGVLSSRWDWLLEEPSVLTSALFVYLRILADHYRLAPDQKLEALKRAEVDFCIRVLRQHFGLCMGVGRDLVRLLQDVVSIPEFRDLWKDLIVDPSTFGVPGYSDISQIYRTRTPAQYFLLGITPEMETRLRFLLTHVKWGSQRRYQEWFARKFLCRPERETIVVDLVRFICCAHHPPNEIIRSSIIQRWAVIGWLLKSCRKNYFASNAKLALFFDWLFFDEKIDNIMNIEPAILLMLHSVPEYVDLTQTLMEFLFLLVDHYDEGHKDLIFQGVLVSFNVLVKKGVVQSLEPLSSCSIISPLLRERLSVFIHGSKQEVVKELTIAGNVKAPGGLKHSTSHEKSGFGHVKSLVNSLCATVTQTGSGGLETLEKLLIAFAALDDQLIDEEVGGNSSIVIEALASQITEAFKSAGYDMFPSLDSLEHGDDDIQSATSVVLQSYIFYPHETMVKFISFWSRKGCPVGARMLSYASRLAEEVGSWGRSRSDGIVEVNGSEKFLLQQHIDGCVSFRVHSVGGSMNGSLATTTNLKLIVELVEGAFVAYRNFLRSSTMEQMSLGEGSQVESFPKSMSCEEPKTIDQVQSMSLFSDVLSCCNWKRKCRRSLFCCIFHHLSDLSTGKEQFIQLLVEKLDHADLVTMEFEVSLKAFSVFGKDPGTIIKLVRSSVNWEFMKQQKLWGLLVSELTVSNFKLEKIVEGLCTGFIDACVHSVAIEGLYTLLRCCSPTPEMISAVVSLPGTFQDFAAAVLASWLSSNNSSFFNSLSESLKKHEKTGNSESNKVSDVRLHSYSIFDGQNIKHADAVSALLVRIPGLR